MDDYYFYLVLLKCLEDYGMFVLEDFFLRLLGVRQENMINRKNCWNFFCGVDQNGNRNMLFVKFLEDVMNKYLLNLF